MSGLHWPPFRSGSVVTLDDFRALGRSTLAGGDCATDPGHDDRGPAPALRMPRRSGCCYHAGAGVRVTDERLPTTGKEPRQ